MLRQDDFTKMREMVMRLRKHRQNEAKTTINVLTNGGETGNGGMIMGGGPN